MYRSWLLLLGLWTVAPPTWAGDELLNVCMNTKHHKREPGPEDQLYKECNPWRGNACCRADTSLNTHLDLPLLYNFSLHHCGVMLPDCEKHFLQAICLYQCSPNLGPWIQKAAQSEAGLGQKLERQLPQAMLLAFLSPAMPVSSWTRAGQASEFWRCPCAGRTVSSGGKTAARLTLAKPTGMAGTGLRAFCHPFPHYFPTPVDLCEKIWSHSFKASPEHRNSGQCLQKWFEPAQGNPNVAVTRLFASTAPSRDHPCKLLAFSLLPAFLSPEPLLLPPTFLLSWVLPVNRAAQAGGRRH
ncbi:sperm-egg fusion protein Juno isoform X2 [Mustela nigripes]|uniref:sperm-egg fusion protein Juno isoform X1 n=1 Tax=Mustela lutreola TaxID=9666 RepID=UPI0027977927|nr:sperm-egg fusion protein Juno isoform X1 [Mustela lutreola]XP_059042308.1 sperm-egg fusion protein Juno isoform X1 [Mustela lutreola]XP_059042314.1 sperm-egg fusion protein Juno isoform X1 [Mustela lutreola]XP_059268821.1 sperm-egg fusion protein Juno isoform X2 [Mustela nigripes]XP_059268830.1 sperm-egg fusion protein Juno isoform X2 [Mustela nigripes]XP_059268839.1 sperm-egg fusion protein Juno isoform X2 [Mustela nigripes]XP_059268849.1 sperm-egg fusion protein Juno isoform X2 [Mustela 